MSLHILDPGALSLIEDAGRPGFSASGVGASGVFDRRAARIANSLVGNDEGTAVIENLGGLRLEARRTHRIAFTGASGPAWIDDRPVDSGRAHVLHDSQVLRLGPPVQGLRWVLAVAGGILTKTTLGSASRDTLADLGPAPLARHDLVGVGAGVGATSLEAFPSMLASGNHTLAVTLGPRDDWFRPAAISTFVSAAWTVESTSDRIGVRLDGPLLARANPHELLSEPVVRGSVQVTNSGLPVVLGPDHPVTGGYPVIAVVADRDLDTLAQVRPGDTIRFTRGAGFRRAPVTS